MPKELELITTVYRFSKIALICASAQMFNRTIYFRFDVLVNKFMLTPKIDILTADFERFQALTYLQSKEDDGDKPDPTVQAVHVGNAAEVMGIERRFKSHH